MAPATQLDRCAKAGVPRNELLARVEDDLTERFAVALEVGVRADGVGGPRGRRQL